MPRVRLIHWKAEEADARAKRLEAAGFRAEFSLLSPPNLFRKLKSDPPDAVVIDLTRLPSHGREIGAWLKARGVRRVFVCGLARDFCVRASAVDAYSHGFHVTLVEECCFDRSMLSHKVNLFDLHHKYADVMKVDEVVAHLDTLAVRKAS